jgi:hypothetical protein
VLSHGSFGPKITSALRAQHSKGPVPPKATKERLIDPCHSEGFEDASLFECPRIERLEPKLADKLCYGRFCAIVVAGKKTLQGAISKRSPAVIIFAPT